jgi:plastocyanin
MNSRKASWVLAMAVTVVAGIALIAGYQKGLAAAGPQEKMPEKMPAGIELKIDNFSFGPMTLTVAAGTTVTWTNNDDVPHTVVSDDKTTFRSKALDTGDKFSYTFTKPGKYPYFCSVHPKMVAEVVVQ